MIDEKTEARRAAASDPAAQLVQLRQAEAIGMLDDDHRGIGNVDADFDDRGGDKNSQLAVAKFTHYSVALLGLHPAVHQTDAEIFEQGLAHFLGHLGGVAHLLQLFRRFDQGQNDKSLMAALELFEHH